MNPEDQLPPLPPSDPASLQRNHRDSFYDLTVREFWGENQVTQHQVEEFKKCKHFFAHDQSVSGVSCRLCHIVYIGQFEIRDGKLVSNKETGETFEF